MEQILLIAVSSINQLTSFLDPFIAPQLKQAVLIIGGIFLVALLLGVTRHHMLEWSIKGAGFGILLGVVLTLVVEGFLLVGGRTAVAEVLRNKNTPVAIRSFIQDNMMQLAQAIGSPPQVLNAATSATSGEVVENFNNLSVKEQSKARTQICAP
ncbi:hypothetical protein HY404_01425 [Candidatus Microgenomates bacterium]|nr:hypothetical protein [Candidatus Microgenomates bacterium]